MIINNIHIENFRGFVDVKFKLGKFLTLIAGQNGTQKTTLLGMLSQPFTISDEDNLMKNERPLCGGTYKSAFKDKFRLSKAFDKPKCHEWTLFLNDIDEPFTLESMSRSRETGDIRFWRKGDRSKGSGYIQIPVIYLSMKRLLPMGEDSELRHDRSKELTTEEKKIFLRWYNKILISEDEIKQADYLTSKSKDTLGVTTEYYDWESNSAGQDNIGKILLAILSFRRLQKKYEKDYKGGILAIDEIDATLYPGSQIELINALQNFCSKFNIQVLTTSHSLSMIERVIDIQQSKGREDDNCVVYLKKIDNNIEALEDLSYKQIKNHLNVALGTQIKHEVLVFSEDAEGREFAKSTLGRQFKHLKFIECNLSCDLLIDLARRKVPPFKSPESIIILDGDTRKNKKLKTLENIVVLPGNNSPERLLAQFLSSLSDTSSFWQKFNTDYSKQLCFRNYKLKEILNDRDKAKKWYKEQKDFKVWGRASTAVYKLWLGEHSDDKEVFLKEFEIIYNKVAKKQGINL